MPISPELQDESQRLYRRYQTEVVERFNLCPWAKAARETGNATALVRSAEGGNLSTLLAHLQEASTLASEVVLLILPDYTAGRTEFDKLVASLIRQDAQRYPLNSPPFALAAFHPEPAPNPLDAQALVALLRRTPDPTIQLVRLEALERVRKGEAPGTQFIDPSSLDLNAPLGNRLNQAPRSPLRQRIAEANYDTFVRQSIPLRQAIHDVGEDRRQTHARLGLQPGSWERE